MRLVGGASFCADDERLRQRSLPAASAQEEKWRRVATDASVEGGRLGGVWRRAPTDVSSLRRSGVGDRASAEQVSALGRLRCACPCDAFPQRRAAEPRRVARRRRPRSAARLDAVGGDEQARGRRRARERRTCSRAPASCVPRVLSALAIVSPQCRQRSDASCAPHCAARPTTRPTTQRRRAQDGAIRGAASSAWRRATPPKAAVVRPVRLCEKSPQRQFARNDDFPCVCELLRRVGARDDESDCASRKRGQSTRRVRCRARDDDACVRKVPTPPPSTAIAYERAVAEVSADGQRGLRCGTRVASRFASRVSLVATGRRHDRVRHPVHERRRPDLVRPSDRPTDRPTPREPLRDRCACAARTRSTWPKAPTWRCSLMRRAAAAWCRRRTRRFATSTQCPTSRFSRFSR